MKLLFCCSCSKNQKANDVSGIQKCSLFALGVSSVAFAIGGQKYCFSFMVKQISPEFHPCSFGLVLPILLRRQANAVQLVTKVFFFAI